MNRRLGTTLGVLIVATACVELVVLGWYVVAHDLPARTLQMYAFGLGLPAIVMLAIGGWLWRRSASARGMRRD
jgi:hypothetical protein